MTKINLPRPRAFAVLFSLTLAACNALLGNEEHPLAAGGAGGTAGATSSTGGGSHTGGAGDEGGRGEAGAGEAGAGQGGAGEAGAGEAGAGEAGAGEAGAGGFVPVCRGKVCDTPPTATCKTPTMATTFAPTGTCSDAGDCSYASLDKGCDTNKACAGAGVCSVCKVDTSCGASCIACAGGLPKCRDNGTTSQCVACLSNADCTGATPVCNTATNVCGPRPSCVGLAATCAASGNADCCASNVVTGGMFNRSNDASYPATVGDFRLDTYEITVGRFRRFVNVYAQNMIVSGAGKNPNNASDPGWDTASNTSLAATSAALTTALKCSHQTWTDVAGTAEEESLPINCLDWFEAEAFCIWDGGRLPTEAEWNYAAAGGTSQRVYPWNSATADCAHANFNGGAADCVAPPALKRVGSESPAGDGMYGQADLAGNVWEWVQDWFVSPYSVAACGNCSNLTASSNRVQRGGSYLDAASDLISSYRNNSSPSFHHFGFGARCARPR